jgi:hypothetical protein
MAHDDRAARAKSLNLLAGAGGFEPPRGGNKSLACPLKIKTLHAAIMSNRRLALKYLRAIWQTSLAHFLIQN